MYKRSFTIDIILSGWLTLMGVACSDEANMVMEDAHEIETNEYTFKCSPQQSSPYPQGIPYVGIHGNAGNSDYIDCRTSGRWRRGWHALRGLGMTQPNTFSPDGLVTYVTTTNPEPDGCRLFAIDVENGQYKWCRSYHTLIERSSVEVDELGHLYFTIEEAVVSLNADGVERWRASLTDRDGESVGGWGVHFTPQGYVATVTSSGRVYLLDRDTGASLNTFDISSYWGFVSPETFGIELDPSSLLPSQVQSDIQSVWGQPSDEEQSAGFGALLGSGAFVDNTVAVSKRGDIYIIGGGPSPQEGAVVQLKVSGTIAEPQISPSWYAVTEKGSATTPSISSNDRYLVISDGAHPTTFINPSTAYGEIKVYDIEQCDANTDSDPDPQRCAQLWSHPLARSPMVGAPAILDDGTVIYWEMGLAFDADPQDADVVAVNQTGILWESSLPDDMDWSSVVTVTQNHVIGSASRVTPSDEGLPGFKLPIKTMDRLVVLDRTNGELVWYHDLPDDCAATVTVGPDGSLYVPMLGIFSILAIEERPTLGLMRFIPDMNAELPPKLLEITTEDSGSSTDSPEVTESSMMSENQEVEESYTDGEMTTEPVGDEGDGRCFEVEIENLPTCCDTGPARCVPSDRIPDGFASQLSECGEAGLCVPESILEAEHAISPNSCASVGGSAGVCLSTCLPEVARTAALLPQDTCSMGEVCVPCVSPLDGLETGACGDILCSSSESDSTVSDEDELSEEVPDGNQEEQNMNEMSEELPHMPPSCCAGAGTCLAPEIIPSGQSNSLKNCRREGHRELMCVPNDFLDPSWIPQPCVGGGLLGEYEGVCLSDCLKLPFKFALDRSPCTDGYVCAPCTNPLSGEPSGAPGCEVP